MGFKLDKITKTGIEIKNCYAKVTSYNVDINAKRCTISVNYYTDRDKSKSGEYPLDRDRYVIYHDEFDTINSKMENLNESITPRKVLYNYLKDKVIIFKAADNILE